MDKPAVRYSVPGNSRLSDQLVYPPAVAPTISLQAIGLGLLVDFLVRVAFFGLINAVQVAFLMKNMQTNQWGITDSEMTVLQALLVVAVFGGSLVGGWLAAKLGKESPMKHAFVTGLLSLLIGVFLVLTMFTQQPSWVQHASVNLTIPAALLGGGVQVFLHARSTQPGNSGT